MHLLSVVAGTHYLLDAIQESPRALGSLCGLRVQSGAVRPNVLCVLIEHLKYGWIESACTIKVTLQQALKVYSRKEKMEVITLIIFCGLHIDLITF